VISLLAWNVRELPMVRVSSRFAGGAQAPDEHGWLSLWGSVAAVTCGRVAQKTTAAPNPLTTRRRSVPFISVSIPKDSCFGARLHTE
jgi:hypothetical protein